MDRDYQRQRVYDAETSVARQLDAANRGVTRVEVAGSVLNLQPDLRYGSIDAAGVRAASVQHQPWFAARFPRAAAHPATVRHRRGDRRAHYEAGVIALHDASHTTGWQMRDLTLCHELAHHTHLHDAPAGPSHGPVWAGHHLTLVRHVISDEAALLLTVAFANHHVDVTALPDPQGASDG